MGHVYLTTKDIDKAIEMKQISAKEEKELKKKLKMCSDYAKNLKNKK